MTYRLRCGEVVPGCEGEIEADTREEVLRQASDHARQAHEIDQVSDELRDRLTGAIRQA